MTMPDMLGIAEQAYDERPRFANRDDVGDTMGLLSRMLRYFQGNPVSYKTADSANFTIFSILPDEPRAQTAVITVVNASCFYRTDGTNPATNNEQILTPGSIVTLYGQETIKGFIFAATAVANCHLAISYYD